MTGPVNQEPGASPRERTGSTEPARASGDAAGALHWRTALEDPSLSKSQRQAVLRQANERAYAAAKAVLRPGDRLRVTKCPGTKRWIAFAGWDGQAIVSKSGIDVFSPLCVDRLNGEPVDFSAGD